MHKLVTGEQPQTSWVGIALVTTSLIGMPYLGIAMLIFSLGGWSFGEAINTELRRDNGGERRPTHTSEAEAVAEQVVERAARLRRRRVRAC